MLTLIGLANAAPLVHEGDRDEALALSTERTGRVDWESTPWSGLRDGPPTALGGSEVFGLCGDDTLAVADAVRAFRGAVLYADPDRDDRLRAAQQAMACHGATPTQLGELGFLAGVAAHDSADTEGATAWFRAARTWHPDLVWNSDFPSAIQPIFEAAVPSDERYALTVAPDAELLLNGAEPQPVPTGPQLVRVGNRGFWLQSGAFPETVVWPEAVAADALDSLSEETNRATVTNLLSVKIGEGTPFGLVSDDTVWTGTAGRTDWREFGPPAPEPVPETPAAPTRRSRVAPLILTGLGVVVAGTGAALSAEAWHTDDEEPHETLDQHEAARTRFHVGLGAVVGGATVASGGLVWMVAL